MSSLVVKEAGRVVKHLSNFAGSHAVTRHLRRVVLIYLQVVDVHHALPRKAAISWIITDVHMIHDYDEAIAYLEQLVATPAM